MEFYQRWAEPVTFCLAILAIAFAVVQFIDSRIQENGMRKIADSMSTSYIGEFPKNMESIIKVTSAAAKKLDIMVDFAGYGNYSNPEAFNRYFRTLLDPHKGKRTTVRLLLYDDKAGRESRDRQLRQNFETERKSERFQRYFHEEHVTFSVPERYEQFSQDLTEIERQYEQQLIEKGVEIRHTPQTLLFYVWLEDDEEAIFSFQNTEGGEREISFHTRDTALIRTFQATFQQVWNAHADPPSIVIH